jgi:hypothetical protein
MPFNTFPEFGKQLRRSFELHENCLDCADFYDGCGGWRASRGFACEDFNRLPDVMPGTYGQRFPASCRSERAEYRPAGRHMALGKSYRELSSAAGGNTHTEATDLPHEIRRAKVRTCGCGAILPKGKRLCEECRAENRQQTKRDYMRSYMEQRRSAVIDAGSDVPLPATAMQSTWASGGDSRLAGLPDRNTHSGTTSVLTKCVS